MDIAYPNSLQDTCHMNFLIDFAHNVVSCGSFVEHHSTESEGLRFNSSWGLGIFSLSHACHKTEKHLSLFFLPSSKLTIPLIFVYKPVYKAVDIADPSSMQDACHMNFMIDLVKPIISLISI